MVGRDQRLTVGRRAGDRVGHIGDGDRWVEWRPGAHAAAFIDDVHAGKITYYVEAGRGRSFEEKGHGEVIYGPSRGVAHTREIADWVAENYPGDHHRRVDGLSPD